MTEIDYSAAPEAPPSSRSFFGSLFPLNNDENKSAEKKPMPMSALVSEAKEFTVATANAYKDIFVELFASIKYELTPDVSIANSLLPKNYPGYIPYLPAFWNPGWITNYVVGFVTPSKFLYTLEMLWDDVWAGITVSLVLVPQGLSYGTLANMRAISGLYSMLPYSLPLCIPSSAVLCNLLWVLWLSCPSSSASSR